MNVSNSGRFARLKLLLGEGLDLLQQSTVMVLGIGGVGSFCAEALARGGIGSLILIDKDVVEISNINRQAMAFTSTLGQSKAKVMAEMVYEINPECQVVAEEFELERGNIPTYLASFPRPDYVIDCIDLVFSKASVAAWSQSERIPIIASMGAANKLDPGYLEFADINQTVNCALSRVMRKEYQKVGVDQLEVIYSRELPVKIENPPSHDRAHTLGTMSYMPPIMGQMLAGKVIRRLAQLE